MSLGRQATRCCRSVDRGPDGGLPHGCTRSRSRNACGDGVCGQSPHCGLRVKPIANIGAYLSTFSSSVPTYLYATLLSGQYDIPAIYAEVGAVYPLRSSLPHCGSA
jgi:hypothetical protein